MRREKFDDRRKEFGKIERILHRAFDRIFLHHSMEIPIYITRVNIYWNVIVSDRRRVPFFERAFHFQGSLLFQEFQVF